MPSRLYAKREGAPLPELAVMVEQQQGVNAKPGILRVSYADQVRLPRVEAAKRVVLRKHNPDAGQVAARPIDAGRVVR